MENETQISFTTEKEFTVFNDEVFHYKSTIKKSGETGYGTSRQKDLSILKSISEAVERYYFRKHFSPLGINNTNGLACNTEADSAVKSSTLEIIERHVLVTHWHKKISPYWIERNLESQFSEKNYILIKKIQSLGYEINFGILGIINNNYVCISSIRIPDKTGYAISTSASDNLHTSLSKCLEDTFRVVDLIEIRKLYNVSLFKSIQIEDILRPSDHLEYYLNPTNWLNQEWFAKSNEYVTNYKLDKINTEIIKDTYVKDLNLYIAHSKSKQIQNIYFGRFNPNFLNTIDKEKIINLCPHPLA